MAKLEVTARPKFLADKEGPRGQNTAGWSADGERHSLVAPHGKIFPELTLWTQTLPICSLTILPSRAPPPRRRARSPEASCGDVNRRSNDSMPPDWPERRDGEEERARKTQSATRLMSSGTLHARADILSFDLPPLCARVRCSCADHERGSGAGAEVEQQQSTGTHEVAEAHWASVRQTQQRAVAHGAARRNSG